MKLRFIGGDCYFAMKMVIHVILLWTWKLPSLMLWLILTHFHGNLCNLNDNVLFLFGRLTSMQVQWFSQWWRKILMSSFWSSWINWFTCWKLQYLLILDCRCVSWRYKFFFFFSFFAFLEMKIEHHWLFGLTTVLYMFNICLFHGESN